MKIAINLAIFLWIEEDLFCYVKYMKNIIKLHQKTYKKIYKIIVKIKQILITYLHYYDRTKSWLWNN
jgi:hypothetical protein